MTAVRSFGEPWEADRYPASKSDAGGVVRCAGDVQQWPKAGSVPLGDVSTPGADGESSGWGEDVVGACVMRCRHGSIGPLTGTVRLPEAAELR